MLDIKGIITRVSKSVWPNSTEATIDYTTEMVEYKSSLGTNILSCITLACSESHCLPNATTGIGTLQNNYTIGTFQNLCEFAKTPKVWVNAIQLYRYNSGNPYKDVTKYFSQSLNLIGGNNYTDMINFNKQLVLAMGKADEYASKSFISGCMNNFLPVEHINVIDKNLFSSAFDTRGNLGFNVIGASIGKPDSDITYLEYFCYMYQLGINWGIFDNDSVNNEYSPLSYDSKFISEISQEEKNLIRVLYPQVMKLLFNEEKSNKVTESNVLSATNYLKRIKNLHEDYSFKLISNPPYLANPQFCLLDRESRGNHKLDVIMNTHKSTNGYSGSKRIRDLEKDSIDENSSFFVKVANYVKDLYDDWTGSDIKHSKDEEYQSEELKDYNRRGRSNLGNENGRRMILTDNDIRIKDKVSNTGQLLNKLQHKDSLYRNPPIIKAKIIF